MQMCFFINKHNIKVAWFYPRPRLPLRARWIIGTTLLLGSMLWVAPVTRSPFSWERIYMKDIVVVLSVKNIVFFCRLVSFLEESFYFIPTPISNASIVQARVVDGGWKFFHGPTHIMTCFLPQVNGSHTFVASL